MGFFLNNRRWVILITALCTLLISVGFFGMSIDSSITAVLAEDNPDFLYNQEVGKTFTSSETVIISILTHPKGTDPASLPPLSLSDPEPAYSLYTVPHIDLVNRVTQAVLTLKSVNTAGVNSLITIANQYSPEGGGNFSQAITQETVDWVKRTVETNPMARGKIINAAHTNTVILVPIPETLSYEDKALNRFLAQLQNQLDDIFQDYPQARYELTGQPKVKADITKYIMSDITVLLPIAILVVMLSIFFMTRSFRGTLIPLTVTLLSVIWTFGFKGLLGMFGSHLGPLTLTESVLPVVLISVACADGIHITNQSLYFIDRGVPGKAAVQDAMKLVRLPVILSAVTTAVGFGSLIFSPGRSLKNMGLFLAFGVLVAMVFSLFLIPVLISYFRTKRFSERRSGRGIRKPGFLDRFIGPFIDQIVRFKWPVVGAGLLLILLSVPATLKVKTDQDEVRFFVPSAPVRIATENIEKNLGGISTLYLVTQGIGETPFIPRALYQTDQSTWTNADQKAVADSLIQLRAMELIQRRAEAESAVSYTSSYVSYLQLINYLFKGKLNEANFVLPKNPLYFSKLTLTNFEQQEMVGDDLTRKFITDSGDQLNLNFQIQDSNTSSMEAVVNRLNAFICKLYQLDPKVLPDYARLRGGDPYTLPPKSAALRRQGKQRLRQVAWMQNEAKRLHYPSVEAWYRAAPEPARLLPLLPGGEPVTAGEPVTGAGNPAARPADLFLAAQRLQAKPDFASDWELRLIADQFSVRDLTYLADHPIRFRWAGDYIRIVNGSIIIDSQIISLFTATFIILILLSVIFRSLLTGILLSMPVILAIFINFTVMWMCGISLNPATSIVASVGMGVGIDYAIHYYSRFRKVFQMTGKYEASLSEAAVQSSGGIVDNALAVAIGFLILTFSKYTIIKQMGLIVALTMVTSAFGALTLLPALLALFQPRTKKKRMPRA